MYSPIMFRRVREKTMIQSGSALWDHDDSWALPPDSKSKVHGALQ